MLKKVISLFLACIMTAGLCSCGKTGGDTEKIKTIGISMHTGTAERWKRDAVALSSGFQDKGYQVELLYTEDGDQKEQIRELIEGQAEAIVVTADDPTDLADVLAEAADKGIKVIAYDRLPTNTQAVDALVTFDSREVGRQQAQAVVDALGLDKGGKGSIVMIGGSKKDSNAAWLYEGALSVLQPYFDSGALQAVDGKTAQEDVLLEEWSAELTQVRMREILEKGWPDVVLCGNDMQMSAAAEVVDDALNGRKRPTFIGQDCATSCVLAMSRGEDVYSVFKDTNALAARAVEVTDSLLGGGSPEADGTLNNGEKDVATYFSPVVLIDKDNVQSVLLDNGKATLPDGKKIAVIRNLTRDDHTTSFFNGAMSKGQEHGYTVKTFVTETDDALMQETLRTIIDSGEYAGIVVSHGKEAYSYDLLKRAADKGIKIVTFDTVTKAINGMTTTAQDDEALARLSLDALIAASPNKPAKLVKVWYDKALAPFSKRDAVYKEYEAAGKIQTVAEIYPEVTSDKLRTAVNDTIVSMGDFQADGIWAAWDELAKGVYEGLVLSQKTDVPMVSIDLSDIDRRMMANLPEVWQASAYVDAKIIGETCMELLINKLNGVETPDTYTFEATLALASELE